MLCCLRGRFMPSGEEVHGLVERYCRCLYI
jgi:hypothetical protein